MKFDHSKSTILDVLGITEEEIMDTIVKQPDSKEAYFYKLYAIIDLNELRLMIGLLDGITGLEKASHALEYLWNNVPEENMRATIKELERDMKRSLLDMITEAEQE